MFEGERDSLRRKCQHVGKWEVYAKGFIRICVTINCCALTGSIPDTWYVLGLPTHLVERKSFRARSFLLGQILPQLLARSHSLVEPAAYI